MAERPIKQMWADYNGAVDGFVCEDGTLWKVARWESRRPVWERIPGPPADPPEPVGALPEGVSVEQGASMSEPSHLLVILRVGCPEAVITPSEARALAHALIEAAG